MKNFLSMVVWVAASATMASGQMIVTVGVGGDLVDPTLSAGDIIAIPLSIQHEGREGVCGVALELAVRGDALRIRSVTFDPAFGYVLSEGPQVLPAKSYRSDRAQPFRSLDLSLGANGTDVPLVTVELEVLSQDTFSSRLTIHARGTTIGQRKPHTVFRFAGGQPTRSGRAKIRISNRTPADPWITTQSTVDVYGTLVGDGRPVPALAANTTYELHYEAAHFQVNNYVLFAVATSPEQGISGASTAPAGAWHNVADFVFVDLSSPGMEPGTAHGYPAGYYRYQMVAGNFGGNINVYAGPVGHLCNFTTRGAGELNLHLILWADDPANYSIVEMEVRRQFIVRGIGGADPPVISP